MRNGRAARSAALRPCGAGADGAGLGVAGGAEAGGAWVVVDRRTGASWAGCAGRARVWGWTAAGAGAEAGGRRIGSTRWGAGAGVGRGGETAPGSALGGAPFRRRVSSSIRARSSGSWRAAGPAGAWVTDVWVTDVWVAGAEAGRDGAVDCGAGGAPF